MQAAVHESHRWKMIREVFVSCKQANIIKAAGTQLCWDILWRNTQELVLLHADFIGENRTTYAIHTIVDFLILSLTHRFKVNHESESLTAGHSSILLSAYVAATQRKHVVLYYFLLCPYSTLIRTLSPAYLQFLLQISHEALGGDVSSAGACQC